MACRVCLAVEVKLYPIQNLGIADFLNNCAAIEVSPSDGKPQHICYECHKLLMNCRKFIDKCQRAEQLLNQLQINDYNVSIEIIKTIDRKIHKLESNIVKSDTLASPILHNPDIVLKVEIENINDDEDVVKKESDNDYYFTTEIDHDNNDIDDNDEINIVNNDDLINDNDNNEDGELNSEEEDLPLTKFVKKESTNKNELSIEEKVTVITKEDEKKTPYKYCVVPKCKNSVRNAPKKVFFFIPRGESVRKNWCNVMNREMISSNTSLYCCEDHFDIEQDTENYMQYKIMKLQENINLTLRLKKGVYPHKFECQNKDRPPPINKKKSKKNRGFNETYAEVRNLSKAEQIEEMNERSKSLNYLNSPYKCNLCFKGFVENIAFSNHQLKHHKSSGVYECDLCHLRYPLLRQLRTHLCSSHTRQYVCKQCSHRSHTANQAREHEKWHKGFLYSCKLCEEKFKKPTSYLTHMRKRHPTEFVCAICGGSFVGRHGLLMHIKKTHAGFEKPSNKNPEIYCKDCDIQFWTKEAWIKHIISTARHLKEEMCKICHLKLLKTQLDTHYKNHAKDIKLKNTLNEVKPEVKLIRVSCKSCGSSFVNKSKLQSHERRVHFGFKYNKNLVCEQCGKKCTSNATLKYHQRTHTGERPYLCNECPKRFADSNQLKIHNRTHTDERPYACNLCSKTFRQKPALNRHLRVHTGVKPYHCQYCAKTFTQSNSAKLHIKTVHLKLPSIMRKRKISNNDNINKTIVENEITLRTL